MLHLHSAREIANKKFVFKYSTKVKLQRCIVIFFIIKIHKKWFLWIIETLNSLVLVGQKEQFAIGSYYQLWDFSHHFSSNTCECLWLLCLSICVYNFFSIVLMHFYVMHLKMTKNHHHPEINTVNTLVHFPKIL